MQEPPMPHTKSPDSDRLPFHPKYLNHPGHASMSGDELHLWLHDDPNAPPLLGSQPTSAGNTRPVSPSAPGSPVAPIHHQLSNRGRYQAITREATPEDIQEESTIPIPTIPSRGHSPRSPLSTLLPFTLIHIPVALPPSDTEGHTSREASPEEYTPSEAAPPGGHHPYSPMIFSPGEDAPRAPGGWTTSDP